MVELLLVLLNDLIGALEGCCMVWEILHAQPMHLQDHWPVFVNVLKLLFRSSQAPPQEQTPLNKFAAQLYHLAQKDLVNMFSTMAVSVVLELRMLLWKLTTNFKELVDFPLP